ncbi:MAG: ATP-binding protein, partial [Chloroflexota bacterium]
MDQTSNKNAELNQAKDTSRISRLLTMLFIVVALLPMGLVTYISFLSAQNSLIDQGEFKVEQETQLIGQDVEVYLSQFPSDLLALSDTFPIQAIFRSQDNGGVDPASLDSYGVWISRLTQSFSAVQSNKLVYQQIRLLNEDGSEIVRVDFYNNRVQIPFEEELKNQVGKDYFESAKDLSEGEVFISSIELNNDYPEVPELKEPVIRYSAPIFDNRNEFRGVIVANVYASAVLSLLESEEGEVYLTDEFGTYLFHPDQEILLNQNGNGFEDFPLISSGLTGDTNTFAYLEGSGEQFIGIKKIQFDQVNLDRHWLVIRTLPGSAVIETGIISQLLSRVLLAAVIIGAITLAAGILITRSITNPIKAITSAVTDLSHIESNSSISINPVPEQISSRNDELGILANSFNDMTVQLKHAYDTLEYRVRIRTHDLEIARHEAEKAKRTAEKANEMKTIFLSNMSHELRTPLNTIINMTGFVVDGNMGEINNDQLDALNQTIDSGEHLLDLINDILDISKIEAGMLNISFEALNLRQILQTVAASFEGQLDNDVVAIEVDLPEKLPHIQADRRRIRQIFTNLMSNAVKYTLEGRILLTASFTDKSVLVTIEDSGIGIPPADQERIFQHYEQAANVLNNVTSTGLGLPISKQLVEIHHGKLWVESS